MLRQGPPPPSAQPTGNDKSIPHLGRRPKGMSPPALEHAKGRFPTFLTERESPTAPVCPQAPGGGGPAPRPLGPESPTPTAPKGHTAEGRQARLALGCHDWYGRGRGSVLPAERP